MEFSQFDTRLYPTLSVEEGYTEWAETYDDTVCAEMDLRMLERIEAVHWSHIDHAVDLACGTGRVGDWLRKRGVRHIDGLDLCPEMLARARDKGVYEETRLADIRNTPLLSGVYDLAMVVLADEHIADLGPMYREAARIAKPAAFLVVVGYHPHFMMKGIPTHFDRASGTPAAIETYVHLLSDHAKAARKAGWSFVEMDEGLIDDAWIARKPKWERYRNHPISFSCVWRSSDH